MSTTNIRSPKELVEGLNRFPSTMEPRLEIEVVNPKATIVVRKNRYKHGMIVMVEHERHSYSIRGWKKVPSHEEYETAVAMAREYVGKFNLV